MPILASLLLLSACTPLTDLPRPDPADYYSSVELHYDDHTYIPTVRTVQLFKKGFELSPPIIALNAADPLVLRFDDLSPEVENLSYTVVHCNADWSPSDLSPNQYIDGMLTDFIPTPRQSFNTLQPFLEYEVEFPNEMMRPTLAGNYLLKVFRGSDQDDLILTRRFLVFEDRVQIDARILPSRDVEMRDVDQQLDLTLRHPGIVIPDPFSDLHVTVLQNMRWDDAHTGFRPKFIRDAELIYDHPKEGIFKGSNEWRGFDLKSLRYSTLRIAQIATGENGLEKATLLPDEKREYKVYFDQPDINGRYLVRNDLVDGDPLGADYVQVAFTLPRAQPLIGGDVYVYGAVTDYTCKKEFRCHWDETAHAYTLLATMKQGFVDYMYAFLPTGASTPDLTTLEGSHYQTENDYLVLVYVRDYQLRCDRLLGLRFVNSRNP